MKNGAFIIWMLGWWGIEGLTEYLYFLEHGKSFEVTTGYAWFILAIWIFVASLVYEKREK